jgi:predicted DCC family thiol-disulfide oxidoreductase YuxK
VTPLDGPSLPRPLLIWDGECSFCRAWIARWRRSTGDRVDYAPYQEVADRFPEIPRERFRDAVQLIEPDGTRTSGAEAVLRTLAHAPGKGWVLALYRSVPGFAAISNAGYRLIARHRPGFDRLTVRIWGPHLVPPGRTLTAWIFLRLLGLTFLIAFVSLWTQIIGLVGERGILPAGEYLTAVREHFGSGAQSFAFAPTLAWLGTGDRALHALCATGTFTSLLLLLGFVPVASLIACWTLYLSLTTVGQNFLWFQWDGLLLETAFLSILLAPWRWHSRPSSDPPPPRLALWLLAWLLFRLMVSSAAVKLTSGDASWHNLTALEYHYETQCLPPWTAWYGHHLPAGFQHFSAAIMMGIEGLVPFLLFAPRRIRFAGLAALIGLQLLIAITGNYGFFNLLSIALCLLALDDGVWPWRWRATRRARMSAALAATGGDAAREDGREVSPSPAAAAQRSTSDEFWRWITRPVAIGYLALSLVPMFDVLLWPTTWLGPLPAVYRRAEPFRTVDRYGLFAVMTTRRPEIVLEGSDDGARWRPYEFRWKPGDRMRRPEFMAPHMPRLDWQMWFAALSDFRREPWFLRFCERLLEGSPTVLRLMGKNPFPDAPPRYLRAVLYDYHFSDAATRRTTGAWWTRKPMALYCPVLTLVEGRLAPAPMPGAAP